MKAPCSLLNTHIESVKGIITVGNAMVKDVVDIRCTSEFDKETLSLTYKDVQIVVEVKDIEKLIEETRKDRKDKA